MIRRRRVFRKKYIRRARAKVDYCRTWTVRTACIAIPHYDFFTPILCERHSLVVFVAEEFVFRQMSRVHSSLAFHVASFFWKHREHPQPTQTNQPLASIRAYLRDIFCHLHSYPSVTVLSFSRHHTSTTTTTIHPQAHLRERLLSGGCHGGRSREEPRADDDA